MPQIRCHYIDCVFLDEGFCINRKVEFDPELGCLSYSQLDELLDLDDEEWEEIDEPFDGYEEVDLDDEEPDLWLDEE